ncbi:Methylthioribose-1-phosphate isomerase [bioreactor metagenome]|uniref:Methylthioribose-1-phosphate isomerase n=1 Tax=bioreactor metagenome TaxID=1076179 RepID=A0A645E2D9_9ZZZZ
MGTEQGNVYKVYCDETRPLLQGARLTAFELASAGIDTTVICDNMAGSLMAEGKIQAVFVGCDRVASNGDTANKIGTMPLAILAKHFDIPFYVCAPGSTIDMLCSSGKDIQIEQRSGDEITKKWYEKPMVSDLVKTYNPAFDVTQNELITAFVTEFGVVKPPFKENFKLIIFGN